MTATWRKDPFIPGRYYRVRTSFVAYRDSFKEGEILLYAKNGYSIYDSMSGFFFIDSTGQYRSWDLADGEPLEPWNVLFELMEDGEGRAQFSKSTP